MSERIGYRVVMISPSLWRAATAAMSPLERAALVDAFTQACLTGDDAFLDRMVFAGRRLRARAPRKGVTALVRRRVLARTGGRCAECGSRLRVEVDHVVPVVHGGSDDEANLQPLCRVCNRTKGPQPYERRRMATNG